MNIREILEELEIPYREAGEHEHVREGWLGVDCPFCSPDWQHWRLGINLRSGGAHCWACGRHGLTESLRQLSSQPYNRISGLLRDFDRSGYPPSINPRGKLSTPRLCDLMACHRDYLLSRGLDPDYCIKTWGVRGIGLDSKLAWRIWIPIHFHGEVVSWTTRSIATGGNNTKRYIVASPEQEKIPAKSLLLGADLAGTVAIAVEGPLDAMRIGPGAVAFLGLSWTQAQLSQMASFPTRYVCLDNEPVAQKRAKVLCRELSAFPGKTINVEIESGKDAGECSEKEIRQLRRLLK